MIVEEAELNEAIIKQLISLSGDWESEDSCCGYRRNTPDDIKGNRVFLAADNDTVIGYLLGQNVTAQKTNSIYKEGTIIFEIEELYVRPECRSQGIGRELFQCAEKAVAREADLIVLNTATKNYRAILHFYIDELGMDFWSARLFKRIGMEGVQ